MSRSGFTFVELCIGLVVLALVIGAIASFTLAMANAWKQGESSLGELLVSNQVSARLSNSVEEARWLGSYTLDADGKYVTGPISLWMHDHAIANDRVEYGEIAILEYDKTSKRLLLWEMSDSSPTYKLPYSTQSLLLYPVLDELKLAMQSKVLASNVHDAKIAILPATSKTSPALQYELQIKGDKKADGAKYVTERGSIVIRAPQMPL